MTASSVLAQALRRDIPALLQDYRAGTWVPSAAEREFAEGVARCRWDGPYFRAALGHVPAQVRGSRLLDIVLPATDVLDQPDTDQDLVVELRSLVDALTPLP